jgi:hypothetical protein
VRPRIQQLARINLQIPAVWVKARQWATMTMAWQSSPH